MGGGLGRVLAHLDSFMAGRVADFDRQLSSDFRYSYLPPILGVGPVQARRWHAILTSIYRTWTYEIEDSSERNGVVVLRVRFVGSDAVDPATTPAEFQDSCLLQVNVEGGLLTVCNAHYLELDDRQRDTPWMLA